MGRRKSRSVRTIVRTVKAKARRSYGRRSKGWGGIAAGLIAGALPALANRFNLNLGTWTQPASDIAVGYYMGNETLQTIGGRSIGAMLAGGALGGSTSSSGYAPIQ